MHSKSYSNTLHKQEVQLKISSTDNVTLDARLFPGSSRRDTVVILTHPYGPLGGNLDNNVVYALFQIFASQGYMTLRFNFRGVGNSSGKTSLQGAGEIEDVLSVYKYLKRRSDLSPRQYILVGYSYGSIAIGAAASEIPELAGLISISYPSGVSWALTLWNGKKYADAFKSLTQIPKLFMSGDKDNFTSVSSFKGFTDGIPEPKTVLILKDVDHFWTQWEDTLVGHVRQWLAKNMNDDLSRRSSRKDSVSSTRGGTAPMAIPSFPSSSSILSNPNTVGSVDPTGSRSSLSQKEKISGHVKSSSESRQRELPARRGSTLTENGDMKRWSMCQDTLEAIDKLLLDDLVSSETTLASSSTEVVTETVKGVDLAAAKPKRPPPPVPTRMDKSTPGLDVPLSVPTNTNTTANTAARRPSRPPPPIPSLLGSSLSTPTQ